MMLEIGRKFGVNAVARRHDEHQSRQLSGSMRRLVSLMKVSRDGVGTRLDYKLEIEPAGIAATVMSKDFLQHEITEQFTAIVGVMVKRDK